MRKRRPTGGRPDITALLRRRGTTLAGWLTAERLTSPELAAAACEALGAELSQDAAAQIDALLAPGMTIPGWAKNCENDPWEAPKDVLKISSGGRPAGRSGSRGRTRTFDGNSKAPGRAAPLPDAVADESCDVDPVAQLGVDRKDEPRTVDSSDETRLEHACDVADDVPRNDVVSCDR